MKVRVNHKTQDTILQFLAGKVRRYVFLPNKMFEMAKHLRIQFHSIQAKLILQDHLNGTSLLCIA